MKILLNGVECDVPDASSIADLLQLNGYGERRVAVELNRSIVPRSRHAGQHLDEGDQVEIVHAIGGG